MVKKVGPYQLERKLGEGSYGTVFLGTDTQTNQLVAAKAISLENLKSRFLEQLEAEISAMKQLDSPYIVKLFDVLKTSRNVYMVMEYCPGGDLDGFIKKRGPTPEHLARKWLAQVIEAFQCLKALKIIHRDLKLANILLSDADPERADVKLADFGFAKILNEATRAKTMLGTPLFMAPEIFNREEYTYSVDIWSLGVLAYEVLVGKGPFQCKNIEELKQAQKQGVQFPSEIVCSEAGKDLVSRMLAYRPADRPSLEELQVHPFFTGAPALTHTQSWSLPLGSQSPELYSLEAKPNTPNFRPVIDVSSSDDNSRYEDILDLERRLSKEKGLETLVERFLPVNKLISEYLLMQLTSDLDELSRRVESLENHGKAQELVERVRMKRARLRKWAQTLEEAKASASPDLSATTEIVSEKHVECEAERIWTTLRSCSDPFEKMEGAQDLLLLLQAIDSKSALISVLQTELSIRAP